MHIGRRGISGFQALVRFACVLALLLVAFAHRPMAFAAVPFDVAAYTLPDGTIPDLCVPGNAGKGEVHPTGCEFCRLASSVILPEPDAVRWPALPQDGRVALVRERVPGPRVSAFLHPVRGPPSTS
jgi:hypothetical protein